MTRTAEMTMDARWAAIEHLPLPVGIGNLSEGLCAAARIAYAETGEVTDELACAQVCLRSMIAANDALPDDLRQQLGSVEYRDALLRTTPGDDDRLRWVVAEQARQSALRAFAYAGLDKSADGLRDLPPITDSNSAAEAEVAAGNAAACANAGSCSAAEAAYAAANVAAYAIDYAYAEAAEAAEAALYASYAGSPLANRQRILNLRALLGLPAKAKGGNNAR